MSRRLHARSVLLHSRPTGGVQRLRPLPSTGMPIPPDAKGKRDANPFLNDMLVGSWFVRVNILSCHCFPVSICYCILRELFCYQSWKMLASFLDFWAPAAAAPLCCQTASVPWANEHWRRKPVAVRGDGSAFLDGIDNDIISQRVCTVSLSAPAIHFVPGASGPAILACAIEVLIARRRTETHTILVGDQQAPSVRIPIFQPPLLSYILRGGGMVQ